MCANCRYGVDELDSDSDAEGEGSTGTDDATGLQQMLGSAATSEDDDGSGSPELGDGPGPSGLQKLPVTDSPSSDGDEEANPTVNPTATFVDPTAVSEEEFGRTKTLESQVVESAEDVNGDRSGEEDQPPPRLNSVESQEKRLEEQLQPTNSDKDEVYMYCVLESLLLCFADTPAFKIDYMYNSETQKILGILHVVI